VSFLRNREDLSIRDRKAGVLDASRYGRPVAQLIRSAGRLLSDDSRLDESSSEDPSASCSPAELASVSPTICDSAKPKSCCPAFFRLSGQLCLNSCLSEGDKSMRREYCPKALRCSGFSLTGRATRIRSSSIVRTTPSLYSLLSLTHYTRCSPALYARLVKQMMAHAIDWGLAYAIGSTLV
jgi:hypothetical protein